MTQNYELAVFTEMANQPATMEASACADAFGCLPGNTVMQADAEQAYTQAKLGAETNLRKDPQGTMAQSLV